MKDLYQFILKDLQVLSQIQKNERDFILYLQSLQNEVKNLRQSYRTNSVSVDYSRAEVQAAYLITYYPQYAEMTRHILEKINTSHHNLFLFEQKHLKVCLFGAGAAPEAIGLASFLAEYYPKVQSLEITVYDIFSDTWKIGQNITKNIIPKLWQGQFSFSTEQIDFCQAGSFFSLENVLNNSQIFVFQNCLNELDNFDSFNLNIRYLLSKMPNNSLLMMVDLYNYQRIENFKIEIKQLLQELDFQNQILCLRSAEMIEFKTEIVIPAIITQHLLIGTPRDINQKNENRFLVPKKNMRCNFLSVYKTYKHEVIKQILEQLDHKFKILQANGNLQQQERYNLLQQIKILRIALIVVSAIAFISLVLSTIALRR
jgi:hypothetical protein